MHVEEKGAGAESRDKRAAEQPDVRTLPAALEVRLNLANQDVSLTLEKNTNVDVRPPVFVARNGGLQRVDFPQAKVSKVVSLSFFSDLFYLLSDDFRFFGMLDRIAMDFKSPLFHIKEGEEKKILKMRYHLSCCYSQFTVVTCVQTGGCWILSRSRHGSLILSSPSS